MASTDRSMEETDIHVELLGLNRQAKAASARGDRLMHDAVHNHIDRELDALDKVRGQ